MIDPELVGNRSVAWQEYSTAIDDFLVWLRHQYALGTQPPGHDPGDWERRIRFDEPSLTIWLDEVPYSVPTRGHLKLVRELVAEAMNNRHWISRAKLAQQVVTKSAGEKVIERLLEDMPAPFCHMIEGGTGRGMWIRLPRLP